MIVRHAYDIERQAGATERRCGAVDAATVASGDVPMKPRDA
jgi:hypothetical protein